MIQTENNANQPDNARQATKATGTNNITSPADSAGAANSANSANAAKPARRVHPRKAHARTARTPRTAHTPRHTSARPHAGDMPTGARALVPHTLRARIIIGIAIIVVAAIVIFDLAVAHESITSENYYQDPAKEYAADIVDTLADAAVKATPDSANAAINSLRERLTGRSRWANTVIDAEQYWGLGTSDTYLILAIIQVESGGDENVDSVGNIMQVEPVTSYYTDYILGGVPDADISACTPEASIYAGVKIVQDALYYYKDVTDTYADLDNHPQAAVIAQGYNYGYPGWLDYCAQNGVTEWTYWHASNYQALAMQGGGDCNYGQKIIDQLDQMSTN